MSLVTNLSGAAGSSYSPLRPASGCGSEHAQGPFTAELAPTLLTRASGAYPEQVWLGLLSTKPDPDGMGGEELSYPGYERQAVELSVRSASHFTIGRPILFDIHGCPLVTGAAIFDVDGRPLAQGLLRGLRTAVVPPSRFEFASHQILVRRVLSSRDPTP